MATEFHPFQVWEVTRPHADARLPSEVTLRAYDVYSHIHGPQPAMIDLAGRDGRGGFGVYELIAFLYARSFPKEEWSRRAEEAFKRPPESGSTVR